MTFRAILGTGNVSQKFIRIPGTQMGLQRRTGTKKLHKAHGTSKGYTVRLSIVLKRDPWDTKDFSGNSKAHNNN